VINGLIVASGRGQHFPEFATLRVAESLVGAAWALDNALFYRERHVRSPDVDYFRC
jgi:hypothetical protein